MEDEINIIDEIVKKSLDTDKEMPETSWSKMESFMNKKGVLSKSNTFFPISHNIKTDIVIFSGVLIIASGLYFLIDQPAEIEKESVKIEKRYDKSENDTTNKKLIQSGNHFVKKDSVSFNKLDNKKKSSEKQVQINVTVPVHKKVIIKKQIIIKDTLN